MNQTDSGISRIAAVLTVCAMFSFSHFVQAKPVAKAPEFDHSRTGFLLRDVHNTLKCEQCHVEGIFKNTPKDCAGCHTTGTRVGAKPKPINHVPTTSACDICHISAANFMVKSFQHIGIAGGCSTCHNGQSTGVLSKPVNHVTTLQPCETCHKNTSTFLSWTMDHTGITSGCVTCHQGQFPNTVSMPPAPTAHVAVQPGQDCSSCHIGFTTFLGAVFNHSGIGTATCASCHSGQMLGVVKLPSVHIPISAGTDCNVCHISTITFQGALLSFSHAGVTSGSCDTCHSGTYPGVLAKPANHIPTSSAKCDACHDAINTVGYTSFKGSQYHAMVVATAGSCAACHNGSYTLASGNGLFPQSVSNASGGHIPVASSSCDLCHTAGNTAYYSNTNFQGASYHASQTTTPGSCSTCHNGAISTQSASGLPPYGKAVTLSLSGVAHVTTTAECDTCHTQATTVNYTTFLGSIFDHAAVTPAVAGRCSACHGNITPAIAKQKSASHTPTTAQCDTCHTQSNTANYSTFLGAGYHATTVVAAGSCGKASCHDGSGTAGAVGKPATHLTSTAVCDTCHTSSTIANYTTWLNAKYHVNVTAAAGSCGTAGCHDGSINGIAMGATGKSPTHVGTLAACDTCHTSTTSFLGALYSHVGVTAGSCDTCHSGANPGVKTKPANHIPTASAKCDACHNAINTVGYTAFTGAQYHVAVTATAGSCTGCHNGSYTLASGNGLFAQSLSNASGGHIPVASSSCDLCHTAGNTALYSSFQGSSYHASQTTTPGSCSTCHSGAISTPSVSGLPPYGKAATLTLSGAAHAQTNAECDTCHTQALTLNYTTFLGSIFDHAVVTPAVAGRCSACHGNITPSIAKQKSGSHMPTTAECDTCHTQSISANYTTFGGAGYHAGNVVAAGSCGKASCHDGSGTAGAVGKPGTHLTTTAVCDSCHTPSTTASFTTWKNAKYHVNVTVVAGSCGTAGCHDGSTNGIAMGATGKSSTHVGTLAACDTCHISTSNYTTWLTAIYTHIPAANGTCQTCHGNGVAQGQLAPHIPATGTCDAAGCHTTALTNYVGGAVYPAAWLGATYAPHPASVAGTCKTCHTGTYPNVSTQSFNPGGLAGLNGQPHMLTSAQCDTSGCHVLGISYYTSATPTWAGAGYAHSAADSGQCAKAGCHGAGGAGKGVSTNHIPVSVSCDSGGCHKVFSVSTPTFAGGIWVHSVTAGSRCDSCHGKYLGFGLYGATGVNGVPKATAPHIPIGGSTISGANDCNFCHTSSPPNTAATSTSDSWSVAIVSVTQHSGDLGGVSGERCTDCHLSSSPYYAPGIKRISHNGASNTKDCTTAGCHKPGPDVLDATGKVKTKAKGVSWSSWT